MNKLKKYGLLSLSLLALGLVGCNSNGSEPSVLPSLTPSETKPSEELPTEKPSESVSIAEKYTVSFSDVEGASISLDHEDKEYEEGQRVEITITLSEGKALKEITSEDVEISDPVTKENIVTASFVMPNKNVSFSVSVFNGHKVAKINNYDTLTFETLSLKEGDVIEDGKKAVLTVSASTNNFSASSAPRYYIEIDGTRYHPTIEGTAYVNSFSIEFTRPSKDIVINLSFAYNSIDNEKGHHVTLEENEYVSLVGYDKDQAYTSFSGKLLRQTGYKVTSVKVKIGDGEYKEQLSSYSKFNPDNLRSLYINSITADVSIKVEGSFTGAKKISYVNLDAVSINSGYYEEATEGDVISVNYKVSPKYTLDGKPTLTGTTVPDSDYKTGYFKYTVGTEDITITFPAKENGQIEVVQNADLESYKILVNRVETNYCEAGKNFTLYPVAKEGKVVTSARVIQEDGTAGEYEDAVEDASGKLTVPLTRPKAGNCKVEVKTQDGIVITNEASDRGTLTLYRNTYLKGDQVNFYVTPESKFYTFEKLINADTQEEISTTRNGSIGYFTRPDVTSLKIKAVFSKVATISVSFDGFDSADLDSYSVSGNQSGTSYTSNLVSAEFLQGETIFVSAYLKDSVSATKALHIYKTVNGVESEVTRSFIYYQILVEKGLTKISVKVTAKE